MKKMLDPYKTDVENPDALSGHELLESQLLTWAIDTGNLDKYTGIRTPEQLDALLAEMDNGQAVARPENG